MMTRPALALLVSCSLLSGAEKWIRATSPNFELYTSQGERQAKETILYFEQVREFFGKALGLKPSSTVAVRIILFDSDKQYAPYRFNEFADAYYQQGIDRDYIVMGANSAQANRVAVHEYVHLLCNHAGLRLPVWLNEGIAEVYSTLQPQGGKALVGSPIDGHLYQVRSSWIPLPRLLEVGQGSPEYNKRAHAGTFYAQSWALTHMLMLDKAYRPKFDEFFQAIATTPDSAAAMQRAFGSNVGNVEKDLQKYVRGDRFFAAVFPFKLEKAAVVPVIEPVDLIAARAAATGVLVGFQAEQTSKAIDEMLAQGGDRPEVAELAAYAAWRTGDFAKSRAYFEKALSQPNPPAKLLLDAARLQLYSRQLDDRGLEWTKKAIEMQPDWFEARIQLAEQYLAMRNYQASLAVARRVTSADLKNASRFYRVSAYAAAAVGYVEEAERSAALALKYARDMRDREAVDRLQSYVKSVRQAKDSSSAAVALTAQHILQPIDPAEDGETEAERPILARRSPEQSAFEVVSKSDIQTVEGTLIKLECLDGPARLHIQSDSATVVLAIRDPNNIAVKSNKEGTAELQCGDLNYKVAAGYLLNPDQRLGTSGDLVILNFQH
jgi:tetratricopeptide (TPR) repeat protein